MELEPIVKQAEKFLRTFYRNLYDYHRAQKPSLPLGQAVEAAAIFNLDTLADLRQAIATTPENGNLRRLFRFVATWLLRQRLLPLEQELAAVYDQLVGSSAWAEHDALSPGQPLPPRPQPQLLNRLTALYEQRWQALNEQFTACGFDSPAAFYAWTTGVDPADLLQAASDALERTSVPYQAALQAIQPPVSDRWQLEACLQGDNFTHYFPAAELAPVIEDTLYHLGLDVNHQPNLVLEISRELPAGLALAFPVRVPEEIYVCVGSTAGINTFEQVLRLSGMVTARLLRDPQQSWFERRLADPALDAAYGELFASLIACDRWRSDLLGKGTDCPQLQAFTQLRQLYRHRLAAARVIFAVSRSHGCADNTVFRDALAVDHDPSSLVLDMGQMRNAFDTFRGLQAGANLADRLIAIYGTDWYRQPTAAQKLRRLLTGGPSCLGQLTFTN